MSSSGIVHLVGAGPGDLGLVTFRAKELISQADVLASLRLFAKEVMPAFADDKPASGAPVGGA